LLGSTSSDPEAILTNCSHFVLDLSIAITDKPATPDTLFQPEAPAHIAMAVVEMRQDFDNIDHKRDGLKSVVAYFGKVFDSASGSPVGAIDESKQFAREQNYLFTKKANE
jgi:hypothetical protein